MCLAFQSDALPTAELFLYRYFIAAHRKRKCVFGLILGEKSLDAPGTGTRVSNVPGISIGRSILPTELFPSRYAIAVR